MATRTQIDNYISNNLTTLRNLQESEKTLRRKYRQYKRGEIRDDVEIHEYVRPDGDVGYYLYVYATEGTDEYVKMFHHGNEPIPAQTDWQLIVDDLI